MVEPMALDPQALSRDDAAALDAPLLAPSRLDARWRELHETGCRIAVMAALAEEDYAGEIARFPQAALSTGGEVLRLALRGVEDLDAITAPGLTALCAIAAQGYDTTAAALSLWREFHAARAGLLELTRTRAQDG